MSESQRPESPLFWRWCNLNIKRQKREEKKKKQKTDITAAPSSMIEVKQ